MVSREAAIAATRFGLGARPGELAAADRDPSGWLLAQLAATAPMPAGPLPDSRTLVAELAARRRMGRPQD